MRLRSAFYNVGEGYGQESSGLDCYHNRAALSRSCSHNSVRCSCQVSIIEIFRQGSTASPISDNCNTELGCHRDYLAENKAHVLVCQKFVSQTDPLGRDETEMCANV